MRTDTPQPVLLKDYEPYPYSIPSVRLVFELDPARTRVLTVMQVERTGEAGAAMDLNGEGFLESGAILINGNPAEDHQVEFTGTGLILRDLPDSFELSTEVWISPEKNTELSGLYMSGGRFCTQCEAEGFRRITYWPDRPDVMSVFSVRLEADIEFAPTLLSNGNPGEAGAISESRHYAEWFDPHPKPSYLFALCGGDYDVFADQFTTMSGNEVELSIFVDKGDAERAAYAMDSLKRAMRWDEEVFGREYDLDVFNIVAVRDFNFGAMENKGLNIFNSAYVLADADTATDGDFEAIESIVAHEYFHNWTGNRITCRDWFQLCLKEGLTVYRDQEFSADMRSAPVQRIGDVRSLMARQFPEDQGPLAHPVRPEVYEEIDNFYTATVYNKGAELVRMIDTILGRDGFRKGMDLYFERHDGEAITIEAFLASFEDASDTDLSDFSHWYHQAGTPVVKIDEMHHDDGSRRLTISQKFSELPHIDGDRPALTIPLAFGYVGPEGEDVAVKGSNGETEMLLLTDKAQGFRFDNVPEDARLSINRNFSAPVVLEQKQSPEDQVFIAARDSDPFNRWQAVQNLAMASLKAANTAILAGQKPQPPLPLVSALASLLGNDTLDNSFKAQCVQLPQLQDVAEAVGNGFDPDTIAHAHAYIDAYVALSMEDELTGLYQRFVKANDTATDATNAARRALKNAALRLLVTTDKAEYAELAARQAMDADNMTDRMAALMALCRQGRTERAEPLVDMYERFSGNGLVMDKWLTLQAVTNSDETLNTVRALLHDPVFSMENPNRVRSLIGGFASNFQQFNRIDGAGYQFLTRQVGALDTHNPQIAARLLEGLRSWRKLEPGRQRLARLALEKLREQSGLSSNVADIANRLTGDG